MNLLRRAGLCVALSLVSTAAFAAGFNCAKASTWVEREICASPALSKADSTMNAIWRAEMDYSLSGDKESVRKGQLAWMKRRDTCETRECIASEYLARYNELAESACSATMVGRTEPPYCTGLGGDLEAMARKQSPRTIPVASTPSTPAAVTRPDTPYVGVLSFFGEPCEGLIKPAGGLRTIVAITGFMYAKQQQAGIRPARDEATESVAMVDAVNAACKPGMLAVDAANEASAKLYRSTARAKITSAPQVGMLAITCGTVVNFGGSVRPLPQIATGVAALASFLGGYSAAFGMKDVSPLASEVESACVQMQPMRFADVWVAAMSPR